jgi:hypothetical protein
MVPSIKSFLITAGFEHSVVAIGIYAFVARGSNPDDRSFSGGGIGAAAGAVGRRRLGRKSAGRAVLGGAAGAATGALTGPSQININK